MEAHAFPEMFPEDGWTEPDSGKGKGSVRRQHGAGHDLESHGLYTTRKKTPRVLVIY